LRGAAVYVPAFAGTHCAYPRKDGQAELAWTGTLPQLITISRDNLRISAEIPAQKLSLSPDNGAIKLVHSYPRQFDCHFFDLVHLGFRQPLDRTQLLLCRHLNSLHRDRQTIGDYFTS